MATWLPVTELAGAPPRVIDQGLEPDLAYASPPELVAWGEVDSIPWRIQTAITAPGPGAHWWDHGPVGPELMFMLGRDDEFGGGRVHTRIEAGKQLSASIQFFGSQPAIVAWVGVVSDDVAAIEVRLDDGDVRAIEVHEGPDGFPNLFWFFPPLGATGIVVSVAAGGSQLQTDRLMEVVVPPNANAGTAINPPGYPEDRPPPGWPDDPTDYGPGEGPRYAEEFHLHETAFPLYALSPDRWSGYAGLSGSGGFGRDLTHVRFGYFEEPGGGRGGFEIVNARPDRHPRMHRGHMEDVGVWSNARFPDDDVANFAARFLSHPDLLELQVERGFPDAGPSRVAAIRELVVAGHRVEARLREYRRLPRLRSIAFDLPGTRVTLQGWDLAFQELEDHARVLERLDLGTELFVAMSAAQARSDRRVDELNDRHHGRSD
jgi:hypothetical protein